MRESTLLPSLSGTPAFRGDGIRTTRSVITKCRGSSIRDESIGVSRVHVLVANKSFCASQVFTLSRCRGTLNPKP
jgi:hypothetical protein